MAFKTKKRRRFLRRLFHWEMLTGKHGAPRKNNLRENEKNPLDKCIGCVYIVYR